MSNVNETLNERGARYGKFKDHARIAMGLKTIIRAELALRNKILPADQQQALDTICDKIARIINGDNDYRDNWHDIAGYATLIDNRLNEDLSLKEKS